MLKSILVKAGIFGIVAVLGGSFGAHALKEVLTSDQLLSFQTGVRYQLIHAVVLIGLFLILNQFDSKPIKMAVHFIFWGVMLFSGSIYILTLKNIIGLEILKMAGPITPIGGLLIIIGWILILVGGVKIKSN